MALDFNEQLKLLSEAKARGMRPSRAPQSEINSILDGARLIASSKQPDQAVDEVITELAREIVREDERRVARDPQLAKQRQSQFERMLSAENLGMDEADMKDAGQILRDEELFGFGDIEDAEMAQGDRDTGARQRQLQADRSIARAIERKRRIEGKITPAEVQDLKDARKKIRRAEENQKYFDFGLQAREKIVIIDPEKGRVEMTDPNPDLGVMQQQRTPTGEIITSEQRRREGRRQKLLDLVEGRGAKAQEERFFRGDLTEAEMENIARLGAGGVQRGPLASSTPVAGTPRPAVQGPRERKSYVNPYGVREEFDAALPFNDIGYRTAPADNPDKVEFDIRPQRGIQVHRGEGSMPSTEAVKFNILQQLRARKERNRQGVIDKIRLQNISNAGEDVTSALMAGGFPREVRTPNIINLGGVKDKSADMGVRLGNQRVDLGRAIQIRRPDGSIEWFDGTNNEIIGDQSFSSKPMSPATPAENLNAPIAGETAENFINRNIYDNFGAQNFGEEGIIENLAERGSGGGIPQVNITGALSNLEELVAQKTGVRKGIRSAASLQAAMGAVIAAEKAKGNVVGMMQDGKVVPSPNPGIGEAMLALKIQPAQQQEIANALYQLEAAKRQDVNLDGKERFFGGGAFNQPEEAARPKASEMPNFGPKVSPIAAAEVFAGREQNYPGLRVERGVDNPGKGGDRLNFAKDVRFVNKVGPAMDAQGRGTPTADAAKPFVGRNQDDLDRDKAKRAAYKKRTGKNMPRPVAADVQVYQGMNPTEVRIYQEGINRKNRKGKPYYNDSRKKQITTPEREAVEKIRGMQEGNVFARYRAQRALAEQAAKTRGVNGEILQGTPLPPELQTQIGQWGRPNITPGKKHPKQELLPRPVRPAGPAPERKINSNPTVVEMGPSAPGTFGEAQAPVETMEDTMRRIKEQGGRAFDMAKDFATNPKYQRARRISYGAGGGLAALATILNMGNEEEQEQLR